MAELFRGPFNKYKNCTYITGQVFDAHIYLTNWLDMCTEETSLQTTSAIRPTQISDHYLFKSLILRTVAFHMSTNRDLHEQSQLNQQLV